MASRSEYGEHSFDEQGISVGGFRQTASWGTFSLDATLFHSDRQRFTGLDGNDDGFGGLVTLWQRDLYLDGGWRVNNGLGVLKTTAPPLQRNQYRFVLPTVAFAGTSRGRIHDARNLLLPGAFARAGISPGTPGAGC